ncbi:MAG: serine O-acetyltransferase [Candidatus Dormibacteraceae bacterium]
MNAFAEDLKRWMAREREPRDGTPSNLQLRPRDVVVLFWRFAPVWATCIYRISSACARNHVRILPTILERLNLMMFGIEISSSIPIGPGLYIAHPVGTVIMAKRIGANASFIAAVTVGMRDTHDFPIFGDGVKVGAGARILGGITLGDGCTIGANAVVIQDVPPGATAVGVPARILPKKPVRDRPLAEALNK